MADGLWDFWEELEVGRCFLFPGFYLVYAGRIVECGIEFNAVKLRGVISKFVFCTSGVKAF